VTDGQRAKMEVEMVAKKTRGKPKPNKVYYQPSQGAMRRMQDALHKYDAAVTEKERVWGVDRLVWLVGGDLRDRFEQQMDKLNAAIDKCDGVEHEVDVTLRGVDALERAAIEAGHKPLTGDYIEGAMPDGRVIAITRNGYEAGKVKRENRDMVVYSVDEIAQIVANFESDRAGAIAAKVKDTFVGASVERVKTLTEVELNDEIPF